MKINESNLLDLLLPKNEKKPKKIDFLIELLSKINNKQTIKELIGNSNLPQKEKNILLKKFNIPLYNINSNFKLKTESKDKLPIKFKNNPLKKIISKKTDINPDTQEHILAQLLSHTDINSSKEIKKIEEKIKTTPVKVQAKLVKEIKTALILKKFPKISKIINTKEFQNVKSLEEILKLSEKLKLNLVKIAFSQIDQKNISPNKFHILPILNDPVLSKKSRFKPILEKHGQNNIKFEPKISINQYQKNKNIKTHISLKDLIEANNIDKPNIHSKHKKNINFSSFQVNNLKQKIINSKQTLKHFAQNLKDALENYKPPISKLTLELHPKELGKVDVIIKQRGENLQVQIASNNQTTINFLTSTQQELKSNLVNMGFTNINMDFNSNKQNQKNKDQKNHSNYSGPHEEKEELVIDFSYKYA